MKVKVLIGEMQGSADCKNYNLSQVVLELLPFLFFYVCLEHISKKY